MQVNASVDVDVVALEQDDEVIVMLELQAPEQPAGGRRPDVVVQVVLDRSGSMAGERFDAARGALTALVDRLDPTDRFGVVAFDDEARVVIPAGPIADRRAMKDAIASLQPGSMTNLSAGLLRGIQEARRVSSAGGATVLLVSDGHANQGETDPTRLEHVSSAALTNGVTISTVGIGLDYDDTLLAAIARGGQGDHVFARNGDEAGVAVAGQVAGLLSKTVQAATLTIRPDAPVASVTLWNDLPCVPIEGGLMVELGDLWSGEERKLLLGFAVPAKSSLGLAQIAELELRYVMVPDFVEQSVTVPLHVNVVPGDQAAERVPDPVVRTELVYLRAQEAKRRVADAVRRGSRRAAKMIVTETLEDVEAYAAAAPSSELAEEVRILSDLGARLDDGQDQYAAKLSRMEHHRKSRRRGREA